MKKLLTAILTLAIMLSLFGCEEKPTPEIPEETIAETTTAPETKAETEITTPSKSAEIKKIDTDGLNITDNYYPPEMSEETVEALYAWRKEKDGFSRNCDFCVIDDYAVFSEYSGEFVGNTQTANLAVLCGNELIEIDDSEFRYSVYPMYAIKNNVLYYYDSGMVSGIRHIYLAEFSLADGSKINEFCKTYNGSDEETEINTYSDIKILNELENYIYRISDKWYRTANRDIPWAYFSDNGYKQDNYVDMCREFIKKEKTGGICIGTEYSEVVKLFGEPCEIYDVNENDDGLLQYMLFSDGNLGITFLIEDNVKTVNSYGFGKDTNVVTDSGIGIGSTRQEVISAYKDLIGVDFSVHACYPETYADYYITENTINELPVLVIGGTHWGSMDFSFDDSDRVVGISARDRTSI